MSNVYLIISIRFWIKKLYDKTISTVNEHLKNIFGTDELREDSVIRNFRITAEDGKVYDTINQ